MASRDFYAERKRIYRQIERERESRVITYVTGDRPNMETQVHQEVLDMFADHLDALFPAKRITLILYTRGGDTLAAWSLINLLRIFCDELEIVLPAKAHSAGTLMCLGADKVVMTKQATLGPIDPSVQGPLNPTIPGAPPDARVPVSVEGIRGYIDFAKGDVGVDGEQGLAQVLVDLAQKVHPLVLGQIFRSRSQIQFLARRLLSHQIKDKKKQDEIVNFLSSESGSHDYTINRREAAQLGLNVEKPSEKFYKTIKRFYGTIREELELATPFDPRSMVAQVTSVPYSSVRCVIESVRGGSHVYVSEGTLTKMQVPVQQGVTQDAMSDARTFEGWRHR